MRETTLKQRTATHEAAHLVAALAHPALPVPVLVSIVPDADSEGRVVVLPRTLTRGAMTRSDLEASAVVLLSGLAAADRLAGGTPRPLEEHGAGDDLRAVARLLRANGVRGREATALTERAMKKARAFVALRWPFIEVLARHLERREVLYAPEIAELRGHFERYCASEEAAEEKALRRLTATVAEVTAAAAVERVRGVRA